MKPEITQARLKEVLDYNPETGVFVWKESRSGIKTSGIAGCKQSDGYIRISVDGKQYFAHRLSWLYVHGYFPEHSLDHINRNKSYNRISNLREVSSQCNLRNTGNPKDNTSGVKGVCWSKQSEKWRADIMANGKQKHLGDYKHFDNAVCARLAGEQCLDWQGCDSSSPAFQYVQKNINRVAK